MRLEQVARNVESSGVMEVARATIKATPKLFDMFADSTYQNKPVAITRELTANAIDAMNAAGKGNVPVEVTLPTDLEPIFKVRDSGIGMSHDFMMTRFMAYTDGSTKDQSDTQIGGFGIGSKSPFAYVDQFTIRSVHDAVLSVYTVFKDTDGIPSIGLMGQTTTDEPNGVEVSFPVESDDIQTFRNAAQEALQYFLPAPIVHNGKITPPDYTYVGKSWAMRPSAGSLGVILGGIRYPVATNSLAYDLRSNARLSPLLEYGLDLTMPMGSVAIAMSREGLSYIPRTSEAIKVALEAVIDDVIDTFSNLFDHAPSLYDAMVLLAKEIGQGGYQTNARQKLLAANAKYRGAKLETRFKITDSTLASVWEIEGQHSRRSKTSYNSPKWTDLASQHDVFPGALQGIIIDDLPLSPKSKVAPKVRAFIDDQSRVKTWWVLRPDAGRTVQDIVNALHNPSVYTLTSSLPEPAAVVKVKSDRPRVRMFRFNGGTDKWTHSAIMNLTPSRSKADAVKEVKYADQPASGIMVVMKQFDLPARFHQKMDLDYFKYDDLVFVNESDAPKIKDTFKNFETEFQARLDKDLVLYPELPERIALSNLGQLDRFYRVLRSRPALRADKLSQAQLSRPFGKVAALYDRYVKPLTQDQLKLAPFVRATLPKGVDPQAMLNAFDDKQPKAALILSEISLDTKIALELFLDNV